MKLKLSRYIPRDFQDEFVSHLILNRMMEEMPELKCAKIMAVAGIAGTGKTTNIYALAEAMECKVHFVKGADLVGQLEGASASPLVDALKKAGSDTESFVPITLIDDVENGGLAHHPNVSGTISSEALKGCVMGWADNPHTVTVDDGMSAPRKVHLQRPPTMMLTTNRLDYLYPPMLRHGRTKLVTLNPQGEELRGILKGIFPHLSSQTIPHLHRKFGDQSISFFVAMKEEVGQRAIVGWARDRKGSLRSENWKSRAAELYQISNGASYQSLVAAGEKLLLQSRDTNFVETARNHSLSDGGTAGAERFTNGVHHSVNGVDPYDETPPMNN